MKTESIDIKKIEQKENVRYRDVDIACLMDSIKKVGMLQPIGIIKRKRSYEVLFGNRRFLAMKKLGYKEISAKIFNIMDNSEFMTVNMIENIQRKDVSPLELGRMFNLLIDEGLSHSEIAARLSISVTRVKSILGLFRVPAKYRKKLDSFTGKSNRHKSGKIPVSTADKIININKRYRIGTANLDILYRKVSQDGFGNEELELIMALMKEGLSFDNATKKQNQVEIFRANIPLNKVKLAKLQKKYKMPRIKLITEILSGKVKERIDID